MQVKAQSFQKVNFAGESNLTTTPEMHLLMLLRLKKDFSADVSALTSQRVLPQGCATSNLANQCRSIILQLVFAALNKRKTCTVLVFNDRSTREVCLIKQDFSTHALPEKIAPTLIVSK